MKKDRNPLKAGLFILASIALVVVIVFAIQGTGQLFYPTRSVTAAFDLDKNLGGLKEGDPIRIGGVDEGRVTSITLDMQSDRAQPRFLVRFRIPASYGLHQDAVVQVEQGLTGAADLNFISLGSGALYDDAKPLVGTPSSISALYAIAPQASKFLNKVESKIDPAFDQYTGVMSNLNGTLGEAKETIKTGRETLVPLRDVLGDGRFDLRSIIANVNASTGTLKTRLPTTFDRIDAFLDTTKKAVEAARDTLADIRTSAANVKDITAEARSLVMRNKSKIDHMIDAFRDTSSNLEGASVEIRHSPWRLLYRPSGAEMQNINVIDTARQFAEGASQVNDAAAALRDALKDPNADKKQLQALMDTLNSSFVNYDHVEDALWKAVK